MQAITWSSNLINAVKVLKKQEINPARNNGNRNEAMQAFMLSNSEEKAVKTVLSQDNGSVSVKNWW